LKAKNSYTEVVSPNNYLFQQSEGKTKINISVMFKDENSVNWEKVLTLKCTL